MSNFIQVCSACNRAPPEGFCECHPERIYLCSNCIGGHFKQPTRSPHNYKPLASSEAPLLGINENCVMCDQTMAELVCCCKHIFTSMCRGCTSNHVSKSPGEMHAMVPIRFKTRLNQPGYLEGVFHRKLRLAQRKAELRVNTEHMSRCMDDLREKCSLLITQLTSYRDKLLTELTQAKEDLDALISAAEREAEECLYEEGNKPMQEITKILLEEGDSLEEVFFSYQLHFQPEGLYSALQLNYEVPIKTQQGNVRLIPWLTATSLRLYDPERGGWKAPWTFPKTFIDKYSSAVYLPDGQLLVSGSNPATTEVLKLDPADQVLHHFSPMRTARTGHGVIVWKGVVYVFGGMNLKTCEKVGVSVEGGRWESLPDMVENRQFFNPAGHGRQIYLCGGNTHTIEVFDTAAERFSLLRDIDLPQESDTFAVIVKGTLHVFQKKRTFVWKLGSASRPEIKKKSATGLE